MSSNEIREPIQKRSIEKKEKIIKAGFELICEKGYYNTNTAEIAKAAGVSTGIVYQYFKDKHDIMYASINNGVQVIKNNNFSLFVNLNNDKDIEKARIFNSIVNTKNKKLTLTKVI